MEQLKAKGYGASGSIFNSLKPMTFERTPLKDDEVLINVLYC
ncbi:MAG: NAD(P)-dependent alcohol dehydrogenase, partial [Sphingobacteriaceae bacterium]